MENKNKLILHILLLTVLLLPVSIFASSGSSGTVTYTDNRETSNYSYEFKKITKPDMEKVSIFNLPTSENLYNVPAFKLASATFKVLDNVNQFGLVQYDIPYYTDAYISKSYSGVISSTNTVTLYEKVSYYDYKGLKKIEWIKPNSSTYYFSGFEQVSGGYINIDYYYVVINLSSDLTGTDLTGDSLYIYVKDSSNNTQTLYYKFVNNYKSPFGDNLYNTALSKNAIYTVGSIPSIELIDDITLYVEIKKIYESSNDSFFNDKVQDYYKIILEYYNSANTLPEIFQVGLTISSQHNFNLHLDDKVVPEDDEKIAYDLFLRNNNSSSSKLISNNEKLLLTGITKTSNTLFLSTKTKLNSDVYKKEGLYKDTIYLNFTTDATASDTDTTIDL